MKDIALELSSRRCALAKRVRQIERWFIKQLKKRCEQADF